MPTDQPKDKSKKFLNDYIYLSTFIHLGRTLRNHNPEIRCLGAFLVIRKREQMSACSFFPDAIHLDLIFID